MSKSFEKNLPEGYVEAKVVDAKDKKFITKINVVVLTFIAVFVGIAYSIIKPFCHLEDHSTFGSLIFFIVMIAYIILHELIHGLVYKIFTRQKLTFGLTLSVAFCGVPDIYVYRKTALTSLLAPFVVFTVIFGVGLFIFENKWNQFYASFLFAIHFSGCFGDLYDSYLYLFKFKNPATLMRDTGPKQTFYVKN